MGFQRSFRSEGLRSLRSFFGIRTFCAKAAPKIVEVDYESLMKMSPAALNCLKAAFQGRKAYGAVAVVNIPGYAERRKAAFRAGMELALKDDEGRKQAAAVNNTYPGWSGTPGQETHPLQSSFLFNVKEELPGGKPDAYFGKNIFPSEDFRNAFTSLSTPMHDVALQVLRGCDVLMEETMTRDGLKWSSAGRSLYQLGKDGPALAGRFICYDSAFVREDRLLQEKGADEQSCNSDTYEVKSAGHAGDGLASMRTHTTPVKSAGHAGDGLVSLRVPVRSASHAGDGTASVRNISTMNVDTGTDAFSPGLMPKMMEHLEDKERETVVLTNTDEKAEQPDVALNTEDYWLPWHIDSNFVTLIHKEMYAHESDVSLTSEPEGAGVVFMNLDGDVARLKAQEDAMVLQIGAFAQIYAGGQLNACRHAVVTTMPEGVARFNFCNFWYVPWNTVCDAPAGKEHEAVSTGWNAMMDESYADITMKQSFVAFRQFMTSPEARLQFSNSQRFLELAEHFKLPPRALSQKTSLNEVLVDVFTDIRCPLSYLSLLNLEKAMQNLGLDNQVRYHPVFLNPNVSKEGESLDDYLLREYGISKEEAHSKDYFLYKQGLMAGVNLNPSRRVVNTFDAFCLLELAHDMGRQREMLKVLSTRYFEAAEDISKSEILAAAAQEVLGLSTMETEEKIHDATLRERVTNKYAVLSQKVDEVPHFVLRESVSGNGVDLNGNRPVADWEQVLQHVLERGRFLGMHVPGPYGKNIFFTEANPTSPVSLSHAGQHGWEEEAWPYLKEHFERMDESPDSHMYAEPRFVNHLDEVSLLRMTEAYRNIFSAVPPGFSILDLCSSWTSHYPAEFLQGARVVALGLNERELAANKQASEYLAQDLNSNPTLPYPDGVFDIVTNALSVQYLTNPQAIFEEMWRVLRPGGIAVIVFSHRCFIEKCVRIWADAPYDGEGHVHLLCNYFRHSPRGGWTKLGSVDVSPKHGDPVWMVTAIKANP